MMHLESVADLGICKWGGGGGQPVGGSGGIHPRRNFENRGILHGFLDS